MLYHYFKMGLIPKDAEFDKMYPEYIQKLSSRNWTPVEVAMKAAELLVSSKETKVLDIGSGVGKFCFIGSAVAGGKFTGVEQKEELVELARNMIKNYDVPNVKFINANIKEINFKDYDSFYFFNPFYENLISKFSGNDNSSLYNDYSNYVKNELDLLPIGTKIVTYHGSSDEIPLSYKTISTHFYGLLKLWIKTTNKEQQCILEEQIIRESVSRLKNFGFSRVNEQNIFSDDVYILFFEKILRTKLGNKNILDEVILSLMNRLNNKSDTIDS